MTSMTASMMFPLVIFAAIELRTVSEGGDAASLSWILFAWSRAVANEAVEVKKHKTNNRKTK